MIDEEAAYFADAGFLYLVNKTTQLDLYAGIPFDDTSAVWVGTGIVLLF